jgi:hypothetical protein
VVVATFVSSYLYSRRPRSRGFSSSKRNWEWIRPTRNGRSRTLCGVAIRRRHGSGESSDVGKMCTVHHKNYNLVHPPPPLSPPRLQLVVKMILDCHLIRLMTSGTRQSNCEVELKTLEDD